MPGCAPSCHACICTRAPARSCPLLHNPSTCARRVYGRGGGGEQSTAASWFRPRCTVGQAGHRGTSRATARALRRRPPHPNTTGGVSTPLEALNHSPHSPLYELDLGPRACFVQRPTRVRAAGVEPGRVGALRTGRAPEGMPDGGCPPRTPPQHAQRAASRVQPAEPRLYAWLRAHDVNRVAGGPCSVGPPEEPGIQTCLAVR